MRKKLESLPFPSQQIDMNEDVLVIEITKEDNKLKMSAFEKNKSTDHRHYSEIAISTQEIENLCDDINRILKCSLIIKNLLLKKP